VEKSEVSEFGIMQLDDNARIIGFKEKPKVVTKADSYKGKYLASMGIYAFRASVLKKLLEGNESDFGKEVIPNNITNYKVYAFIFDGYWRDIGTIKSYYETSLDLTRPDTPFNFISQQNRIYTRPRFLPPIKLINSKLNNALIAEGTHIAGSRVENAVVGMRSIVRIGSVIKNSILMGADYYEENHNKNMAIGVGENCFIKNAIIDKNVRIGRDVRIINRDKLKHFDGDNYYIREGIVVVPKNAQIPDNALI
ncbi:MAG: sugar phosphate nucleotidyltransferase, partial [Chlamydiota bacterium]|nr:sugar phosphate nucleotidyltransferase [Chlamydiota bacterium]